MPILEPNSNIPHHQIPTENLPTKSSKINLRLLANILVVIFSAYSLTFILLPTTKEKMSLDQNIAMEIWPQYSLRTSSLKEDIFSTTASLSLIDSSHVIREPLDLAFVVDFPRARDSRNVKAIQYAINDALPLLGDQDRLLTLIFDEESGSMYNYVPLANTTEENKSRLFSNLGKELSEPRSNVKFKGLQTAIQLLNQRENTSPATGIMLYAWKCNREQISEILQGLKSPHAFVFCSEPRGSYDIPFQDNLEELQNSVIGNVDFFVKPEDSALFQGVEIVETKFKEYYEDHPHRMFIGKNLSLFPRRQRLFVVDFKIPNPILPLPKNTRRVNIANFAMIFTSVSGQRVIRSEDFSLEIGRVIIEELEP